MVLLTKPDTINRRFGKNVLFLGKILGPLFMGIICLIVPVLVMIIDPIHVFLKYKLRLAKGSTFYDIISNEFPADHISLYLFNITNAARFLAGADRKLRVEEVGPFVFKEYRMYDNISFSADGKRMTMTPKIWSEFIPEMSVAHPKDLNLTVPNLPLLSSATLLSELPGVVHFAFNLVVRSMNSKAIINLNLNEYLWGYEDPIMSLANKLAPGMAYFKTMGLLDRFYDYDSEYRMEISAANKDKFEIKSVKKLTHLHMEGYEHIEESVQTFKETYEGCGYPPDLTPDIPINIYRLGVCKAFPLEYQETKMMDYGGEALIYTFSNKTFVNERIPNQRMLPDGLMDLSKCYYNLPFGISKPHFLDTDPKLVDRIEGLKPDRKVNYNRVTVDRRVAVTINTEMGLQLNMVLGDLDFNSETQKFTNTVIPLVHVKVRQVRMSDNTMSKFYLVYTTAPNILKGLEAVSVVIGLALITYALRSLYFNWLSRTNTIVFESALENKSLIIVELPLLNVADTCR